MIALDKGFSQGWELFGAEWELGFHQLLQVFDNFLFLEDKNIKILKINKYEREKAELEVGFYQDHSKPYKTSDSRQIKRFTKI